MYTLASPSITARAALATASSPEPHRRLTVAPPHLDRKAGEQKRHACHVAVVLASLIGAAEVDVLDFGRRDARPSHKRLQDEGTKAIGPDNAQGPSLPSDGLRTARTIQSSFS